MKLLLDENISRRIVPALQVAFPGSWRHGVPPRLVQLALGNCTNQAVLQALTQAATEIHEAFAHEDIELIEIF